MCSYGDKQGRHRGEEKQGSDSAVPGVSVWKLLPIIGCIKSSRVWFSLREPNQKSVFLDKCFPRCDGISEIVYYYLVASLCPVDATPQKKFASAVGRLRTPLFQDFMVKWFKPLLTQEKAEACSRPLEAALQSLYSRLRLRGRRGSLFPLPSLSTWEVGWCQNVTQHELFSVFFSSSLLPCKWLHPVLGVFASASAVEVLRLAFSRQFQNYLS